MIRMPAALRRRSSAYSTFCTCSRIWSITTFISSPIAVSSLAPRLGAERVGLAVELLHQEVELAPDRPVAGDQRARRRDVRLQPVELLGHVGLHRDQRQLLRQPRLVDRRGRAASTASSRLRSSAPAARRPAPRRWRAPPRPAPRSGRAAPRAAPPAPRPRPPRAAASAARSGSISAASCAPATPASSAGAGSRPRARRAPRAGRPPSSARGRARAAPPPPTPPAPRRPPPPAPRGSAAAAPPPPRAPAAASPSPSRGPAPGPPPRGSARSSASKPSGSRNRRSSPRPLTLRASQVQARPPAPPAQVGEAGHRRQRHDEPTRAIGEFPADSFRQFCCKLR